MNSIISYFKEDEAISVEQIVFVVAGLIIAIAIGWDVYNTVFGQAKSGTSEVKNMKNNRASGSEFKGAFGQ